MLDVKNVILPGCGRPEIAAHFLTHIDHLLPKRGLIPLSAQYLVANILERFERIVAACHSPGAGQRLMLPGPGKIGSASCRERAYVEDIECIVNAKCI